MSKVIQFPLYNEKGRTDIEQIVAELPIQERDEQDRANEMLDQFEVKLCNIIVAAGQGQENCEGLKCQIPGQGIEFTVRIQYATGSLVLTSDDEDGLLEVKWTEGEFPVAKFFTSINKFIDKTPEVEDDLMDPITIYRFNQLLDDIQLSIDFGDFKVVETYIQPAKKRHLNVVN